jgi:hypothetical protein
MRPILCLVVLATLLSPTTARGQRVDATLARSFKLEFAVPDAPAFTLLEVDQSQILRPTSVRELALAVSDFVGNGTTLSIPRTFAVEFAPALLLDGPHLTTAQYQRRDWLYRLRVSAATQRGGNAARPTQVAFGLRAGIVDRADLRHNDSTDAWRHFLTAMTAQLVQSKQALDDRLHALLAPEWVIAHPLAADSLLAQPDLETRVAAAHRLEVPDSSLGRLMAFLSEQPRPDVDRAIRQRRKDLQDHFWNAFSIQAAFALSARGNDTTGKDLKLVKYAGWLTVGGPLSGKGQWLFGSQVGGERDSVSSKVQFAATISSRVYIGTNAVKFFAEGQGKFLEAGLPRWLFNTGGEVTPNFGGWLTFSAGLEVDRRIHATSLVTNFAYKVGLPSLFE